MKVQLFEFTSMVQFNGTNVFATIPSAIRSVLKPKDGDKVEWIVFNDGSVEVKIIRKEE